MATGLALAGTDAERLPETRPLESARLVAEKTAFVAGNDNWIVLHLKLRQGWHVYWRNAGDSGTPPRLDWRLPHGLQAGAIVWPTPERFIVGPLANYGYENEVFLPLPIRVDPSLAGAKGVHLAATVHVLVCLEECVPQTAELALDLPLAEGVPHDGPEVDAIRAALAAVPQPPVGWETELAAQDDGRVSLRARPTPGVDSIDALWEFFPYEPGLIEPAAAQPISRDRDRVTLTLRKGSLAAPQLGELAGVLVVRAHAAGGRPPLAFEIAARPTAVGVVAATKPNGIWASIGLAFVGGLLLNLMPCVFPVLAVKVLGFVQHAGEGRGRALVHGTTFAAGIVASFWVLAGGLYALRAGGAEIGWGFQLQSPAFVVAMAFLFFGAAMVFFGVADFGNRLVSLAGAVRLPSGLAGSFGSGVLATVVATPCTAPFMGTALGWALVAPPVAAFSVFTALALGMGAPYVALAASPRLLRALPRPGAWMETLKQLLAFPMLATVVWLLWVLARQVGPDALILALAGLLIAGFGFWIAGRFAVPSAPARRRAVAGLAAVVAIAGGFVLALPSGAGAEAGLAWVEYSESGLEALRAEGRSVYVDFTAAWCLTCQVNKRVVFGSTEVLEAFRRNDIVAMRADWTSQDPEITRALAAFGRSGVPLNVLYGTDRSAEPVVLSTVLTPSIVLRAIETHLRTET